MPNEGKINRSTRGSSRRTRIAALLKKPKPEPKPDDRVYWHGEPGREKPDVKLTVFEWVLMAIVFAILSAAAIVVGIRQF